MPCTRLVCGTALMHCPTQRCTVRQLSMVLSTHWLVCVLVPALILALLGLVLLGLVLLGALGAVATNVWLAGVAGVAHCSSNMGMFNRGQARNRVSAICGSCCAHNACADCTLHTAMHGAHPA